MQGSENKANLMDVFDIYKCLIHIKFLNLADKEGPKNSLISAMSLDFRLKQNY